MNKKNSYRRIFINIFKLVYAASERSILRNKCHGQCGEGEGDCDEDNDCLPGFICKSGGLFGLANDFCTEGILSSSGFSEIWYIIR